MKGKLFLLGLTAILSCNKAKTDHQLLATSETNDLPTIQNKVKINTDKNTVKERFPAPKGYSGPKRNRILSDILLKI